MEPAETEIAALAWRPYTSIFFMHNNDRQRRIWECSANLKGHAAWIIKLFTKWSCLCHDSIEDTTPEYPYTLDSSLLDMSTGLSIGWDILHIDTYFVHQ